MYIYIYNSKKAHIFLQPVVWDVQQQGQYKFCFDTLLSGVRTLNFEISWLRLGTLTPLKYYYF